MTTKPAVRTRDTFRNVIFWLCMSTVLLLVFFGWLWYTKVYQSPNRVFEGMLERSLRTSAVTTETTQDQGATKSTQVVQYSLSPTPKAHSLSTYQQGPSTMKTEVVGTQAADYVSIDAYKTVAGKPLDTSSFKGMWAKIPVDGNGQVGTGYHSLITQSVLGLDSQVITAPVPMADLSLAKRSALLRELHDENVFAIQGAPEKRTNNGHLQYAYHIKAQVIPYVHYMKSFAQAVGLHDLDSLDPNTYSGADPFEFTLVVNASTRQLDSAELQNGDYIQTYHDYGLPVNVTIPQQTVTYDELTKRVQAVEGQ